MNAETPYAVGTLDTRKVLPSHTSWSRSVAPAGIWEIVQPRIAAHIADKSTQYKKQPNEEYDGGRLSPMFSALVRTTWWRMAKRSRSRRLWQRLRIPSTATESRYQAGKRTPAESESPCGS